MLCLFVFRRCQAGNAGDMLNLTREALPRRYGPSNAALGMGLAGYTAASSQRSDIAMTVGRPEGRSADRHGAAIVFDSDLPPRSRRGLGKVLSGALYIAKNIPVVRKEGVNIPHGHRTITRITM